MRYLFLKLPCCFLLLGFWSLTGYTGPAVAQDDPLDSFTELNSAGGPQSASQARQLLAKQRRLFFEGHSRLTDGRTLSSSTDAVAALEEAEKSLLALVNSIETEFGLNGSRSPVSHFSIEDGVQKAQWLNAAYVGLGDVYQELYKWSRKKGTPDKSLAGKAIAYYWQGIHTPYFRFRPETSDPAAFDFEIIKDGRQRELIDLGKNAGASLNQFIKNVLVEEINFVADISRTGADKGLVANYDRDIEAQYAIINSAPDKFATSFAMQMRVGYKRHPKQKAVNAISELHYLKAKAYREAAQEYKRTDDWLQALLNYEKSAVRVYHTPVRRFSLKRDTVLKIAGAVLGKVFGMMVPAEELAAATGISVDEVIAAQSRFTEELLKFVDIGGEEISATLTNKQLGELVEAAQAKDWERFRGKAVQFGVIDDNASRQSKNEMLENLYKAISAILEEKIVVNGYWIAVQGTPDYPALAREAYFATMKECFGIEVPRVRSTLATDVFIARSVVNRTTSEPARSMYSIINRLSGLGVRTDPDCEAQRTYEALRKVVERAESLAAKGRFKEADQVLDAAEPMLKRLEDGDREYFAGAPATYALDSMAEVRSRALTVHGDIAMARANRTESGEEDKRRALTLRAMRYYFRAAEQGALVEATRLRSRFNRLASGDHRLPGPLVDNVNALKDDDWSDNSTSAKEKGVASNPFMQNRQAAVASQKLNAILRDLVLEDGAVASGDFLDNLVYEILRQMDDPDRTFRAGTAEYNRTAAIMHCLDLHFQEQGIYLGNDVLKRCAEAVLKTAIVNKKNKELQRRGITHEIRKVLRLHANEQIQDADLSSLDEAIDKVMRLEELTSEWDRESYDIYQRMLERWGNNIKKIQPAAQALNQLFWRRAEFYQQALIGLRQRIERHEKKKVELDEKLRLIPEEDEDARTKLEEEITALAETLDEDKRTVSQYLLRALQFYFMASQTVYYGNEETLAVQLPDLETVLMLSWHSLLVVGRDIPRMAAGKALAQSNKCLWLKKLLGLTGKQSPPINWKVVLENSKAFRLSKVWVELTKAWRTQAGKLSLRLAGQRTGSAFARGFFGLTKTLQGRLLSLAGWGVFLYMRYAHHIELKHNRIVELEDKTTPELARQTFWKLVEREALASKQKEADR